MKRPALQNRRVGILLTAFRARKRFGNFEKRAPTYYQLGSLSLHFTVFLESSKVLHVPQFTFLPDQPTLSVKTALIRGLFM